MGISLKTQKMLWGRAASRCAFEECRKELVMDATETDDESLVGEACHIVARSQDGPRGESELTATQRDKYGNLILLCNIHHKIIDDQHNEYSIEKLSTLKKNHENWVSSQLATYDALSQRDDEVYATYIEQYEQFIDADNWINWTSHLLSHGQPSIHKDIRDSLEELRFWLLNRVWPKRYLHLELAFENFRQVLQDFLNTFDKHSKIWGDDAYETEKFYKIDNWDRTKYNSLLDDFNDHCDLVQDLTLELTRAANYIFDHVRNSVSNSYRLKQGVLLVMSGPHMDFSFKTRRVEYHGAERTEIPYKGLELFSTKQRFSRDLYFGRKA